MDSIRSSFDFYFTKSELPFGRFVPLCNSSILLRNNLSRSNTEFFQPIRLRQLDLGHSKVRYTSNSIAVVLLCSKPFISKNVFLIILVYFDHFLMIKLHFNFISTSFDSFDQETRSKTSLTDNHDNSAFEVEADLVE